MEIFTLITKDNDGQESIQEFSGAFAEERANGAREFAEFICGLSCKIIKQTNHKD